MAFEVPLWALFVVLSCLRLITARRFAKGNRRALVAYRASGVPAVLRNGQLVGVVQVALLLPVLLLVGPWVVLPIDVVSLEAHRAALTVTFGAVLVSGGVSWTLAYDPPTRLYPRWLIEADLQDNFHPARPDWFDRTLLMVSIALGVLGLILVIAGFAGLLGLVRI